MDITRWNALHKEIQELMEKEVSLMRELLGNMTREEEALAISNRMSWNQIMAERDPILQRLSLLRSQRLGAIQRLLQLYEPIQKGKGVTWEQLLPPEDDLTCTILSLRDQLLALTQRVNAQNGRLQHVGHSPIAEKQPETKPKPIISTYERKD